MKKFLFAMFLVISSNSFASDKVVYGTDNRIDVDKVQSKLHRSLARSTAGMVSRYKIYDEGSTYSFNSITLRDSYGMCEFERFVDQVLLPSCSGFLVAPNVLVTAGHCVKNKIDCDSNFWIFDYNSERKDKLSVPKENVYSCRKIIARELNSSTKNDYAIIELDRSVLNRTPLKFRREGKISSDAELLVIGHPSGLPTKIAPGGKVYDNKDMYYFVTNLDTFGGNSGSAVFDTKTGLVEGILVRGATDYVTAESGNCREVNKCDSVDGLNCRGEDVTRITILKSFLDGIDQGNNNDDNSFEIDSTLVKIPYKTRKSYLRSRSSKMFKFDINKSKNVKFKLYWHSNKLRMYLYNSDGKKVAEGYKSINWYLQKGRYYLRIINQTPSNRSYKFYIK